MLKLWSAGRHEFSLHGLVVKGEGHLSHVEAMEMEVVSSASMAEWLRARDTLAMMKLWRREVVSSVPMAEWLRAWDTLAMLKLWSAGRHEFEHQLGHYSRMSS